MKIIVTGSNGQLGHDLVKELRKSNYNEVIGIDRSVLDLTDKKSVELFFKSSRPDIIIHCAAYTLVDKAEDQKDLCFDVNVNATKYLVDSAIEIDAKLVYISTDYVFSGDKEGYYESNDLPNPKSIYGYTKYLGEKEAMKLNKYFIIRISWVFGINGNNFVKTMLRLANEMKEINIVSDQVGSPTYTHDLSILISDMIKTEKYGIYHATNEGICTWYEFAKKIFEYSSINVRINPIKSEQYITKAQRPKNSRLSKESLLKNKFNLLPSWQNALKRYLIEIEDI